MGYQFIKSSHRSYTKNSESIKTTMKVFAVVALTLFAVATAAPGHHGYKPRSHHHPQTRQRTANLGTIAAVAQATPSLSTLLAAVEAAGLASTVNGAGTFTVFAPNDAAFGKLPDGTVATLLKPENKDQLKSILLKHVLPVQIKAGEIPRGTTKVKTVGGEEIEITNTGRGVSIGNANEIATDVLASNGVVHVIDTVIQTETPEPETRNTLKSIAAVASETPSLSSLLAAVKAAGLAETLSGEGTFTVFAPTNAAFAKLPEGTISFLLKPENKKQLTNILLKHVLPVQINAGQIPRGTTKVKTVGGEEIEITNSGEGVSIKSAAGNANVIATDVFASNGVVHVIDTVIQPEEKETSDLKSIAAIASATPSLSTLLAAVKA